VYIVPMTSKWVERQVDEALLLVATQAAFLYAHRRARRLLPKVAVGAAVITGVGAATATAAAGLGAVGVLGGAGAWYRHRSKKAAAATVDWRPPAAGASSVGSNSGAAPLKDTRSELSSSE
jgi:hypothetical protein